MKTLKTVKKQNTLLDLPYYGLVLKGFMVPNGYQLSIQTKDGDVKTLNPGEYSGSTHAFQEVLAGEVEGWTLTQLQSAVQTPFDSPQAQKEAQTSSLEHDWFDGADGADSPDDPDSSPFDEILSFDEVREVMDAYHLYAKPGLDMDELEFFDKLFTQSSWVADKFLKNDLINKVEDADLMGTKTIGVVLNELGIMPNDFYDKYHDKVGQELRFNESGGTVTPSSPPTAAVNAPFSFLPKGVPIPIEIQLISNPGKTLSGKEKRLLSTKMHMLIGREDKKSLEGLRELYTEMKDERALKNIVHHSQVAGIINEVRKLDHTIPYENRVAYALTNIFRDEDYVSESKDFESYQYSTEPLTSSGEDRIMASIPKSLKSDIFIPHSISTLGEVARYLGENLVEDFGVFEEEREYTPATEKIEYADDIRAIPKYKIKGMSHINSRMKHILDVVSPVALNLQVDGELDEDEYERMGSIWENRTNGYDNTFNHQGMTATKYIHDTLMEYVASQPGCEDPSPLIYAWSTGKWGASSAVGYALRFIEAEVAGRDREDEFNYEKFVKSNPDFEKEIESNVKRYRQTYLALREASGKIIDAAFPDGITLFRGFGAGGMEDIGEFLDNNDIQLASLSCFSSSKNIAESFATGGKDLNRGDNIKCIVMRTDVTGANVGMIPSIAVKDGYRYELGNGKSYTPQDGDYASEYISERELTITSKEVFPMTIKTNTGTLNGKQSADLDIFL